jgi:hypothetical protein
VASAVVEVVVSVAVAAAAVVSQEVDPQAVVVVALAVEASVVAVDEEDTKVLRPGTSRSDDTAKVQSLAFAVLVRTYDYLPIP